MGLFWSKIAQGVKKYGECGSTFGILTAALIIGIIGGCALLIPVIGTIIGLVFLIIAFVLALVALSLLGHMLLIKGWKTQNFGCKVLIVLSCLIVIGLIALIAFGSVKHINDNQPANPEPSNTASTIPSQPSG